MLRTVFLILAMSFLPGFALGEVSHQGVKYASAEVEKAMELVDQLEGHGYDRSALHYLKKVLRTGELRLEEKKMLEKRQALIEERMSREKATTLPDLEVMLHFDRPALKPVMRTYKEKLADSTPVPDSFPSNRIDKKKWLLVAVAVVATGAIAYKVTKHLRQKQAAPPNTITIQF